MEYLNYDLRLTNWNARSGTGTAEVLNAPCGESRPQTFHLEASQDVLTAYPRDLGQARDVGQALAEAVFTGEILLMWNSSYEIARERDRGLRLRLHVVPWDLARLPWELLYDGRRGEFLAFDERVSIVRYVRMHSTPAVIRPADRLRIMAVVASPIDLPPLDWQKELSLLGKTLAPLEENGFARLYVCDHASQERLHNQLLEKRPHVIHFLGHADYDPERQRGRLLLEHGDQRSDPIDASEVARTFRRYGAGLVVLNACRTAKGAWAGLASSLVRADVPAVVAMQWDVEDDAAVRFSRAFYRALSLGRSVDECVSEGRVGAASDGRSPARWAAPVLFMRSTQAQMWAPFPGAGGRATSVYIEDSSGSGNPETVRAGESHMAFKTRGPLDPITDQAILIERPALHRLLRLAQQPLVTQYAALLSARQTGKTTLLLQLRQRLKEQYACIFVDLSVLRNQDTRDCFRFVAFRIASELRRLLGKGLKLPETATVFTPVAFLEFLGATARVVSTSRIMILVDEVGALEREASDSFFNTVRTAFTQGRGTKGELAKYLFVFSGAVDLYGLTFGTNSPLNICEKVYPRDFSIHGVRQLLAQFRRLDVPVAGNVNECLYGLVGGHPYLTMRICALLEEARVSQVTVASIEEVAGQMLVEDDNIGHVIRELERNGAARERLRPIIMEGREIPFTRNDPVLAALEMIGAVQATQPCRVRNRLYERALQRYYGESR